MELLYNIARFYAISAVLKMRHFTSLKKPGLPSRNGGAYVQNTSVNAAIQPHTGSWTAAFLHRLIVWLYFSVSLCKGTYHVPPRSQSGLCPFVMESSDAAQSMTSPPGASQVADAIQPVGRSSIRTPHVGNSCGSTVTIAATMEFQPTPPVRGATARPVLVKLVVDISIHAPP